MVSTIKHIVAAASTSRVTFSKPCLAFNQFMINYCAIMITSYTGGIHSQEYKTTQKC
eukprot:m.176787 g.176787  ORF g.176787 m.176787 type:complete len:57 (-) comp31857_c0_seq8:588-758(-)